MITVERCEVPEPHGKAHCLPLPSSLAELGAGRDPPTPVPHPAPAASRSSRASVPIPEDRVETGNTEFILCLHALPTMPSKRMFSVLPRGRGAVWLQCVLETEMAPSQGEGRKPGGRAASDEASSVSLLQSASRGPGDSLLFDFCVCSLATKLT